MPAPTISLCMIMKNEEATLDHCLRSVSGIVDEIVILDTGSTDQSKQIASNHQAKIDSMEWPGSFSIARNQSLKMASCDWILVLDADETVERETFKNLKDLLENTDADGLRVCVRNLQPEDELIRYQDNTITRIFRNKPAIQFEERIHESVVNSILRMNGVIKNTDFRIIHTGYLRDNVQGQVSRGKRNLDLLLTMKADAPKDNYINYQIGRTYLQMGDKNLAEIFLEESLEFDHRGLTDEVASEVHMKLAQICSSKQNKQKCIQHANQSLRYSPDNVISMYLLALAYMDDGNIQLAHETFMRIRQFPRELISNIDELDFVIEQLNRLFSTGD